MGETHKETLNFLFSSADEAVGEDAENPHAQETTHCPEVIEALREEFDFSERQAEHVVSMQLGSLTALEASEIEAEKPAPNTAV